ncbi:ABC transporter permease [Labrenzia sp. DG1229]|uniref:ABC transporter permease n=1 Tax=Labrenzia sp. DG1229 TaxID=681847 RepID=UPI0006921717|nr:ABC transporter permease [Labrenzia sp. DG1229]
MPETVADTHESGVARIFAAIRLPVGDPFALAGLVIYAVFIATAICAPYIAPYDPSEILYTADYDLASDLPPGAKGHLLGTTSLGRDIFSQIVWGARSALLVGFTAAFMVAFIGSIVGLLAGYFGGWVDAVLMRLADVAFGIPFLPFVIVISAFSEPSIWNTVIAMGLVLWRDTGRVIRSQVLSLRSRGYVEAARVVGSSDLKIILRHITPNILPLSFLYGSIAIGWAILTEASISFLGFGDPDAISWGFMLQDAFASQALARQAYYWFIPPGLAIILVVSAGFFISRGYENLLFPKLGR